MRTPRISPTTLLVAVLAGAFGALVGGAGGLHVQLRALRMRVDGHDDELVQTNKRLSRRDGQAGRDRQLSTNAKLEAELQQIVEAGKGVPLGKKGNGAPASDAELLAQVAQLRGWGPGKESDPE